MIIMVLRTSFLTEKVLWEVSKTRAPLNSYPPGRPSKSDDVHGRNTGATTGAVTKPFCDDVDRRNAVAPTAGLILLILIIQQPARRCHRVFVHTLIGIRPIWRPKMAPMVSCTITSHRVFHWGVCLWCKKKGVSRLKNGSKNVSKMRWKSTN